MPRFNVGDRVRVREGLEINHGYEGDHGNTLECGEAMLDYCGTIQTIGYVDRDGDYNLRGISGYYWNDGMLEPVDESEINTYAIGDRVLVRDDLVVGESYGADTFVSGMEDFIGRIAVIESITLSGKYNIENGGGFCYTNEMFVGLAKDTQFEIGDRVRVASDLKESRDAYCINCNSTMPRYRGMEAIITSRNAYGEIYKYRLNIDDGGWSWTPDMLEPLSENTVSVPVEECEDLPTLMVKNVKIDKDAQKAAVNALTKPAVDFLNQFEYGATKRGVKAIIKEWYAQKAWLIALMAKHQFYNGNYQIQIPAKLDRPIDIEGINTFISWAKIQYKEKLAAEHELKVGMFGLYEYTEMTNRVKRLYDRVPEGAVLNGLTKRDYYLEYKRMCDRIREACIDSDGNRFDKIEWYAGFNDGYIYVSSSIHDKYMAFSYMLNEMVRDIKERENPHIISERQANHINDYAKNCGFTTKAIAGQKICKWVGKLLKEVGLNKVVDPQKTTWTDATTGELRERIKDMGYNYHFALLGDSINPNTYDREVIISVNPFDFWTMSFGYKWSSCHTIDKTNSRNMDDEHNYHGMYSSGTESYMLDDSSIIVWVKCTDEELAKVGETDLPLEQQSKWKRCVFMLGEDKLIQSRVYPDGRDGGDEGICGQLREIVQGVIAELLDTSNMWTLKKGSCACDDVITEGDGCTHYLDYSEYEDGNVSYLKRVNGNKNNKRITVGASPICPRCGIRHSNRDSVTCEDCWNGYIHRCARCNAGIHEEDDYIETVDGNIYCCSTCADRDGYVLTYDSNRWVRREDTGYDDYDEEYYEYTDDGVCVDGYWYHNEATAERAGYIHNDETDEWEVA